MGAGDGPWGVEQVSPRHDILTPTAGQELGAMFSR